MTTNTVPSNSSANLNQSDSVLNDTLNIQVYSTKGINCTVDVSKTLTGGDFKIKCINKLSELEGNNVSTHRTNTYNIIHTKTRRKLDESKTLKELNITSQGK